tara:strand:- start:147 stop:2000 length:1854 start_codon:yes stop_codon:yes gene_type:complete
MKKIYPDLKTISNCVWKSQFDNDVYENVLKRLNENWDLFINIDNDYVKLENKFLLINKNLSPKLIFTIYSESDVKSLCASIFRTIEEVNFRKNIKRSGMDDRKQITHIIIITKNNHLLKILKEKMRSYELEKYNKNYSFCFSYYSILEDLNKFKEIILNKGRLDTTYSNYLDNNLEKKEEYEEIRLSFSNKLVACFLEPQKNYRKRDINLNKEQSKIALAPFVNRNINKRLKGVAGSGKSLVIAARACTLACRDNKKVLIVCFNLTMINYLNELKKSIQAKFYPHQWSKIRENVKITHFHGIGKKKDLLNAENSLSTSLKKGFRIFDAILIDEGQDFKMGGNKNKNYDEDWIDEVLHFAKSSEPRELLIAGDTTQNIYTRNLEKLTKSIRFYGPWNELKKSYRLPSKIINVIETIKEFLPNKKDIYIPYNFQPQEGEEQIKMNLDCECTFNWTNAVPSDVPFITNEIIQEILHNNKPEPNKLSIFDTNVITPTKKIGADIYKKLNLNIDIRAAFNPEAPEDQGRNEKVDFHPFEPESIKISTIHSFKGWETSSLIIILDDYVYDNISLLYVALTRLCAGTYGSYIHIINTSSKLNYVQQRLLQRNLILNKGYVGMVA